jgi:glycosyltransferase involved in cell wall biosynthesis
MKIPISAVIICKNEEKNISRCIKSLLAVSDDIIVVDSGSTDNTLAEARQLNARVYQQSWMGYSNQKNIANSYALNDFILSLDADEELSPALIMSINNEMQNPKFDVYGFEFSTWFGDQLIRHGGWKQNRHIRLFRKSKFYWNDSLVHEKLVLGKTAVKYLKGCINHYTAPSRSYYRGKMNRYAMEFAIDKQRKNKSIPFWKKYISSSFRFIKEYVCQMGFLDGRAGLAIATEEARYTYLKYKLCEKKINNQLIYSRATQQPVTIRHSHFQSKEKNEKINVV